MDDETELLIYQGRGSDRWAKYDAWLEGLRKEHGAERVVEVARGMVRLLPKPAP